ncbi:hypothetical protein [Actinomadura litoris]|uniref:hypothetical protein n=1 Tax=Actinomadura litoris TaxID=2678616 RepID=UPI001FA7BFD7|nr:hypothetical protein [Actinomadura litoris]
MTAVVTAGGLGLAEAPASASPAGQAGSQTMTVFDSRTGEPAGTLVLSDRAETRSAKKCEKTAWVGRVCIEVNGKGLYVKRWATTFEHTQEPYKHLCSEGRFWVDGKRFHTSQKYCADKHHSAELTWRGKGRKFRHNAKLCNSWTIAVPAKPCITVHK